MANYLEFIADKGKADLIWAVDTIESVGKKIQEVNSRGIEIEAKIKGVETLKEYFEMSEQLKAVNNELLKLSQRLTAVYQQEAAARANSAKSVADENKVREESLKLYDKGTQASLKLQLQIERKAKQAEAAAAKEQKALDALSNDYLQLSKAYEESALKAKNLQIVMGENHPIALQATADANALGDKLKKLDATVGQYRRNVGNYNGVGAQFNQLLRELPNAGISARTFLIAISNNISYFVESVKDARLQGQSFKTILSTMGSSLFGLVGAINIAVLALTYLATASNASAASITNYTKAIDTATAVNHEANKSFAEQAAKLSVLQKELEDNTISQRRLKQIKAELIKEYPALEKSLQGEQNLYGRLYNSINNVTEALKQQAIIKAAQNLIAKETERYLNNEADTWDVFIETLKTSATSTLTGVYAGMGDAGANLAKKNEQQYQKSIDNLFKIMQKAQAKLKDSGLDVLLGDDPKNPKQRDTTNYQLNLNKELNDKIAEQNKLAAVNRLQEEMRLQQSIFNNERNSIDERIEARYKYQTALLAIIKLEEDAEIAKNDAEHEATLARILKDVKSVKDRNALIEKENKRHALTNLAIWSETSKKQTDALQDYQDKATKDMMASEDQRMKGIKSRMAEWGARLKNPVVEAFDEMERRAKKLSKQLELAQAGLSLFNELGNVIGSTYDKGIQRAQEAITRNDLEWKQRIGNIKAGAKTELEAIQLVGEAEAKAATERMDLERKIKEEQAKKAKFEKAMTISSLIADTALASIRALGMKPWTPYNIAQAAIIAGIGAAKIAQVAATPIPQYYKGVESSPEGWAKVGERGTELRINPDGTAMLTPATETLAYLQKGTTIIPHEKTVPIMEALSHTSVLGVRTDKDGQLMHLAKVYSQVSDKSTKQIVNAIRTSNRQEKSNSSNNAAPVLYNHYHTSHTKDK